MSGESKPKPYLHDDAPSQPTLTDAEREAIKQAADDYGDNDQDAGCWQLAATLRGLLERLK